MLLRGLGMSRPVACGRPLSKLDDDHAGHDERAAEDLGLALGVVLPIAPASDTAGIAVRAMRPSTTAVHDEPPVRLIGAIAVAAFIFGVTALIADAAGGDDEEHDSGGHAAYVTETTRPSRSP